MVANYLFVSYVTEPPCEDIQFGMKYKKELCHRTKNLFIDHHYFESQTDYQPRKSEDSYGTISKTMNEYRPESKSC